MENNQNASCTPETTHTFNHPPDLLFGVDVWPIQIPADEYFTDAVEVVSESKRGSLQAIGKPSVGSTGRQTVSVTWQLAPVPGSFVKYHLDVSFAALADGHGRIVVFADRDFWGDYLVVDNKIGYAELNAKGWNDKISSFVVLNGKWVFYTDDFQTPYANSGNVLITFTRGLYPWVNDVGIKNDDISSFRAIG